MLLCLTLAQLSGAAAAPSAAPSAAPARPRIIVSTDIGGTDPDDDQSLVHLLAYADRFDIEALISSPFESDAGRTRNILNVIAQYEQDYPQLARHAPGYPTPDALRAVTKQGETGSTGDRRIQAGAGRLAGGNRQTGRRRPILPRLPPRARQLALPVFAEGSQDLRA